MNNRNPLPPVNSQKRSNYRHQQRVIDVGAKQRAANYFKNNVNPIMNNFLQHVAEQQPDDVLAFMFAFSRKKLAERQLDDAARPESEIVKVNATYGGSSGPATVEINVGPVEDDNFEEQSNAAAKKIQARQRGKKDRNRVQALKKEKEAESRGATLIQAKERGRQARLQAEKAAVKTEDEKKEMNTRSKAKKMGGLLMKAKNDGSLEKRVEQMENALADGDEY
jgi:hypothetical protein